MNEVIETLIESNKVQAKAIKGMLENQQLLSDKIDKMQSRLETCLYQIKTLQEWKLAKEGI